MCTFFGNRSKINYLKKKTDKIKKGLLFDIVNLENISKAIAFLRTKLEGWAIGVSIKILSVEV